MIRIMCSGDLHLGRRPGGLPQAYDAPSSLSPTQILGDLVQAAIDHKADMVLLSGDIIDRDNRFFEAFGPLEAGVSTLAARGIPVIAVAGNHDYEALTRFARNMGPAGPAGGFHLLGAGGVWERFTWSRDGRPRLHIDGWSFPAAHYDQNPLDSYPDDRFDVDPGDIVAGLLHGDLDQSESNYAPIASSHLRRKPPRFWLLGHLHKPMLHAPPGEKALLYPGSPQGLDFGETGPHGPWIVTVTADGTVAAEQIPLARLRYEYVDVDVTDVDSVDEVEVQVIGELRTLCDVVARESSVHLRLLLCRVRIVGRTSVHRQIEDRLSAAIGELVLNHEDITCYVTRLDVASRPHRDLAQLSRGRGAPAALARLLLSLIEGPQGDEAAEDFLRAAYHRMTDMHSSRTFADLPPAKRIVSGDGSPDEQRWLTDAVMQAGYRLLDEMLAQREEKA